MSVTLITRTGFGDFDRFTRFIFSFNFCDLVFLVIPSPVSEKGDHWSRITSVKPDRVDNSKRGGYFIVGGK